MSCYLIFGNLRNRVWSDAYSSLLYVRRFGLVVFVCAILVPT